MAGKLSIRSFNHSLRDPFTTVFYCIHTYWKFTFV